MARSTDLDETNQKVKRDQLSRSGRVANDFPDIHLPEVIEQERNVFSNSRSANNRPSQNRKTSDTSSGLSISRIDAALEVVNKLKDMRREDRESGVPKGFMFANSGCIIFEDDNSSQRRGRKNWEVTFKLDKKDKSSSAGKVNLPGYKYPNEPHVIESTADIVGIGVNWNLKTHESPNMDHRPRKRPNTMPDCTRIPNKPLLMEDVDHRSVSDSRCKTRYPVADALKREGTSLESRKGKTLQKGEWKVMKVWPREASQIQPNILPIEMANHDIPLFNKMKKFVVGKLNNKADTHSIDAHSTTCSSHPGHVETEHSECNYDDAHLDNIDPDDATSPTSTDNDRSILPDLGAYAPLEPISHDNDVTQGGGDDYSDAQTKAGLIREGSTDEIHSVVGEESMPDPDTPDINLDQYLHIGGTSSPRTQGDCIKSPTESVHQSNSEPVVYTYQDTCRPSAVLSDDVTISNIDDQSMTPHTQTVPNIHASENYQPQVLHDAVDTHFSDVQPSLEFNGDYTDDVMSPINQPEADADDATPRIDDYTTATSSTDSQEVLPMEELPLSGTPTKRITFSNTHLSQIPEEADDHVVENEAKPNWSQKILDSMIASEREARAKLQSDWVHIAGDAITHKDDI